MPTAILPFEPMISLVVIYLIINQFIKHHRNICTKTFITASFEKEKKQCKITNALNRDLVKKTKEWQYNELIFS